ncbi:MAG: exosortase/archaeosortase family protein [Acidobacteriaceae bacterium]
MLKSTAAAAPDPSGLFIAPETTGHGGLSHSLTGGARAAAIPRRVWVPVAVLAVLLAALYYRIAIKLVSDWYNIPDYSHGLLIPFFVLYLVWDKRRTLRAIPLKPSWAGVGVVVFALLVLLVGVFGADLFLSRISFVILTIGMIWMLLGRPMLKESTFMLFVFLLAIPLPTLILNHITFPLQIMASKLASGLLPLAGVPVLREGNVIQLPIMQLEVAEACSGIRSLMSLFTVAVIYGYFLEKSIPRRVILALASIPIAVAANAARIFGTGLCVQYWDPDKAVGFFHEFSGWLMFLVSLSLLYLVHVAMRLVPRKREVSA